MSSGETPSTYSALELDDVAELLGVSSRMIRNYIKDNDLPCSGDGRGRRFAWAEVREWYVQYRIDLAGSRGSLGVSVPSRDGETYDEAVLRKVKKEADLLEIKLARERGQVVAIADAKAAMARVSSALRTSILSMPAKLTGHLYGVKDRKRIQEILQREADALCRRLMALRPNTADADAGDDD
jgi:excisionase family DNA binding protein